MKECDINMDVQLSIALIQSGRSWGSSLICGLSKHSVPKIISCEQTSAMTLRNAIFASHARYLSITTCFWMTLINPCV